VLLKVYNSWWDNNSGGWGAKPQASEANRVWELQPSTILQFLQKLCNFRHIFIEIFGKYTFLNCYKVCWCTPKAFDLDRTTPCDLSLFLARGLVVRVFASQSVDAGWDCLYLWVVKLVVTGGSLTRRPKRSLRCLLVEVPWQINEYLNLHLVLLSHCRTGISHFLSVCDNNLYFMHKAR